MKRLHIQGLCLVLQVFTTYQDTVTTVDTNTARNATSKALLPTPRTLEKQQTVYHFTSIGTEYASKLSDMSYATKLDGDLTPTLTRLQSTRNLFGLTELKRKLFNSTQYTQHETQSVNVQSIDSEPRETDVRSKNMESSRLNPKSISFSVRNSGSIMTRNSAFVQYTRTAVRHSIASHASRTPSLYKTITSNAFQSATTKQGTGYMFQATKTVDLSVFSTQNNSKTVSVISEFSSKSRSRYEPSSNHRFTLSTQTIEPSKIINLTLSRTGVVRTPGLDLTTMSSFAGRKHSNAKESSTAENLKTSKTASSSKYLGSQVSQRGNSSYQLITKYLSSSSNKVFASTKHPTSVPSISQSFANKETVNTQTISFIKDSKDNAQSSTRSAVSHAARTSKEISASYSYISEFNPATSVKFKGRSDNKSTINDIKASVPPTCYRTKHLIMSTTLTNIHYHEPSNGAQGMRLYVLAVCLPLALVLGFTLAFVYFKRNKEGQRGRYSVTVEIASETPEDYELKRMYSIVDVTSGINKDFLNGFESRKASMNSNMMDQVDAVSLPKPDQNL